MSRLAAGLEWLEEKACSSEEPRIWAGSSSAWSTQFSGRDEPHKCHLSAPRKRGSSHITTGTQIAQDTYPLHFQRQVTALSHSQTSKKHITLSHFSSPHYFGYSHADSELPPGEGDHWTGPSEIPNIRMKRQHGGFFGMRYGTNLTAQHRPTQPARVMKCSASASSNPIVTTHKALSMEPLDCG